ncbi:MAG: cysteine synthase A [Tenericutes bacterium]|nr:cysteine synthase A [Mycoplasmatota bacterium]
MRVYDNILKTIGNTPLVRLKKIEKEYNLKSKLYAKLESFNPSLSVKVRPAYYMFFDLMMKNLIDNNTVIIESTSGNTGIALAMISAYYGNKCILIMPDSLSKERISYMKLYGAEIILTPGSEGIKGSTAKALELHKEIENSVIPSQFDNPENPESHYQTTAKEIIQALNGKVDYFFAGIGTGGTITGNSKYFKDYGLKTKVIGVEPFNSSVINGLDPGKHKIQGIGAGFIPKNLDLKYVEEVLRVDDEDAIRLTRFVPRTEGISIGISSGAVLSATIDYLIENKIEDKNVVMIFPDSAEKYFSTGIFDE